MNSNSSSGSVGLLGVLFVVFLVLKLTGVIDWAWIWVLAPLWIPFAVTLFVAGVLLAIIGVKELYRKVTRSY